MWQSRKDIYVIDTSVIAETSLDGAMIFCVAVLWLFGLLYYLSPLAYKNVAPIEL